ACPDMASTVKNKLKKQHDKLNPFELKRTIESKLKHIFTLVSVTSNVSNDYKL
ncbi:MAG: hypothetical protein K0S11_805, partial [Gammaproteobacteria bacterium]|nr:hypothetical protein [Gammaproteobacteria bacterium]